MAKIDFGTGLQDYMAELRKQGVQIDGVCRFALYDAAGMVADAIRAATPTDTGDLREGLVIRPYRTEDGFVYTVIGFDGYDRKGTPNSLKARAYESGTSKQPKRPFIRPAVNSVKAAAERSIQEQFDLKYQEIINRKGGN